MVLQIAFSKYPNYEKRLGGTFLKELTTLLADNHTKQIVVTNSGKNNKFFFSYEIIDESKNKKVIYISYPKRFRFRKSFYGWLISKYIQYVLKKENIQPSLLHAHFSYNAKIAYFLSKLLKKPYIITFHEDPKSFENFINKKRYQKLLQNAYKITRPNSIDLKLIDKKFKNGFFIPNFVNEDLFFIDRQTEDNKTKTLITVSSLLKNKRVDLMIKSIKKLQEEGMKLNFLIAGTGEEEDSLKKLIENLNIENVIFLGAIKNDELVKYHSKADLFLLASEFESFGIAQVEANLCGIPIVSTPNFGAKEVIKDKLNGFICNDNIEEYAATIKIALEFKWDNYKIREYVVDRFGSRAIVDFYKKLYIDI